MNRCIEFPKFPQYTDHFFKGNGPYFRCSKCSLFIYCTKVVTCSNEWYDAEIREWIYEEHIGKLARRMPSCKEMIMHKVLE